MLRVKRHTVRCCIPALLTGTSTEYLGRKPWPRVIRERQVIFVLGPEGVGKTSVARQIQEYAPGRARGLEQAAQRPRVSSDQALYMDSRELQHAVLDRVRRGVWTPDLLEARALVLDGPVWLRNRQGLVEILVELLRARAQARRRTIVCQSDNDGSVEALIGSMEAGSIVVVGLRFPKGKRGRLRYARRVCDDLEIPREAARGTETLEPWRYDLVAKYLSRWPAVDLAPSGSRPTSDARSPDDGPGERDPDGLYTTGD